MPAVVPTSDDLSPLFDGLAALRAQVATLTSRVEGLSDSHDALSEYVGDLEARLEALEGPEKPQEPAPVTLVGANVKNPPTAARIAASEAVYGPLGVVRVFSATEAAPTMLPEDGRPVHLSFKTADAAALIATVKAARDRGQRGWWTYFHEPEDNFPDAASAASYRSTFASLAAQVAAAVPDATLAPAHVLMSWSLNPKSGRDWTRWIADHSWPVFWDNYTEDNFAAVMAWADARPGVAWGFTELGVLGTDEERLAALRSRAERALPRRPLALTYFDSTNGGDYPLASYPLTAAYWRSLAT